MKSGTLYVTDLDGTLLNTHDRINEFSIKVINSMVEEGMLFTYATARSLVSSLVVTRGLSAQIPVIAYNGALIIHPSTGEVLSKITFQEAAKAKAKQLLDRHNVCPLVYSYLDGVEKVSWVTGRENDGIRRYLVLKRGDKRLRPLPDREALYDGDIFYYTCIGEREELLPIYEAFREDEQYTCTLQQELYRPEFWCEIMPRQATKANAVLKLKELWNCDRVIAFGDAINDISMFQAADECYAVANAVEELKKIATGVIGSNDEDGVARWLVKTNGCMAL